MKKKMLITIVVIFLILGFVFAIPVIKEKLFLAYIKDIKYDVKITKMETGITDSTGGWCVQYNLINFKESKLYYISYGGLSGKHSKYSNYYNIETKELTQTELEEISLIENMESEQIQVNELKIRKFTYGFIKFSRYIILDN